MSISSLRMGLALVFLLACSSGRLDVGDPPPHGGLKIFVTSRGHVSDFADDPNFPVSGAIAKADAFCNSDPSKPDDGTYKAVLVDGAVRSAKPQVDWPLQPNTTYWVARGGGVVGTTNASAVFDVQYTLLANSVGPTPSGGDPDDVDQVWTGIGQPDFSTGNTCAGWTGSGASGSRGVSTATDTTAFYAIGDYGCGYFQLHLYCVEQP